MRVPTTSLLALVALSLAACGGARQEDAQSPRHATAAKSQKADDANGVPSLGARLVAEVPAGTFGPYLGQRGGRTLLLWAQGNATRKWRALALEQGRPVGEPKVVADAPSEVGLAAVKPAAKDRFALISTHEEGDQQAIDVLVLTSKAQQVAPGVRVDTVKGQLLWIDLVATVDGNLVLWAVKKDGGADLFGRALDQSGSPNGQTTRIVSGARAWQAAPLGEGAAVAVVKTSAAAGGAVEVTPVSADAKPSKSVLVSASPTADPDVDMVAVGRGLVLAWSDRRGVEPLVYRAALDEKGGIVQPAGPATPPRGEQALLRLVPPVKPGAPAYLAWEQLAERSGEGRTIQLAVIDGQGKTDGGRAALSMAAEDGTIPELAATPRGLSALTLTPACPRQGECDRSARIATFVEMDRDLAPIATEPVRLAALGGAAAPLSWGLSCGGEHCLALAASDSAPAKVFAVTLRARSMVWEPAAEQRPPDKPPFARSVKGMFAPEAPLADVALATVGGKPLAAWVTFFDPTTPYERLKKPAPDGRFDPPRALLQTRALDASGEPTTISFRARSLGGVALAPSQELPGQALLAWSALDAKKPEVFATIVDAAGKKLNQKMITRTPGEKSDLAAVAVSDGWVVAWVDERSGDPEVYATKLNKYLQAAGPDQRITNAKGAATGLTLLQAGDGVLAAWADASGSTTGGVADIQVAKLSAKTAAALAAPVVLKKTAAHSFSPHLARTAKGAAIAWLEGGSEPTLMLAALDAEGHVASPPATVAIESGAPMAVALDCGSECHVAVVLDANGRGVVSGFSWTPGAKASVSPARLFGLSGHATQTVRPALLGPALLVGDESGTGGLLRSAEITWR